MSISSKSRFNVIFMAVTAVAVATVGMFAAGASADEKDSQTEWFVAPGDANYDLSLLKSTAGADDKLPELVNPAELGMDGLRPDTVRLVATVDGTSTYVAENASNMLCLVSYIPGVDWVAGSVCTTPTNFEKYGVGLRISNPSDGSEVYLFSDASVPKVASFAKSAKLSYPQSNLIVLDHDLPAPLRAELIDQLGGLPIPLLESEMSDEF